MRLGAVLVDTAVVAYALGGAHPLKRACQDLVDAAGAGRVELHASVEMVQELLFHRVRRTDRAIAVAQARDAALLCILHDFDRAVLHRAIDLVGAPASVGGRDAIHAATALIHGLDLIISPDRAFDRISGLTRIDPVEAAQGVKAVP